MAQRVRQEREPPLRASGLLASVMRLVAMLLDEQHHVAVQGAELFQAAAGTNADHSFECSSPAHVIANGVRGTTITLLFLASNRCDRARAQ
jgi:hypothetical protein